MTGPEASRRIHELEEALKQTEKECDSWKEAMWIIVSGLHYFGYIDGYRATRDYFDRVEDPQRIAETFVDVIGEFECGVGRQDEELSWEYETERKICPRVGVEQATQVTPRKDWELVSVAAVDDNFFYFWRRPKGTK